LQSSAAERGRTFPVGRRHRRRRRRAPQARILHEGQWQYPPGGPPRIRRCLL